MLFHPLACIFIVSGMVGRARRRAHSEKLITSIYFHNPSRTLFEKCILWLKKKGYTFISTDDLVEILEKRKTIPHLPLLITLDDAYHENIPNVFSVAEKHNVPITIFAPSGSIESGEYWWSYVLKGRKFSSPGFNEVEDYKKIPEGVRKAKVELLKKYVKVQREAMTVDELIKISKSPFVTIGSHTVNHPCTIHCSDEELDFEIGYSKTKLEKWLGKEVKYFAYPNGDFNNRDKIYLKKYNYKLAFTTVPGGINPADYNVFELQRNCIIPNGTFAENICRMVGIWQKFFLLFS